VDASRQEFGCCCAAVHGLDQSVRSVSFNLKREYLLSAQGTAKQQNQEPKVPGLRPTFPTHNLCGNGLGGVWRLKQYPKRWTSKLWNTNPKRRTRVEPMRDSKASLLIEFIDKTRQRDELQCLRSLNQKLASELFESCCAIQKDAGSLRPLQLSALVFSLQIISQRRQQLEKSLDLH
jgi:hypothetical protein